MQSCTQKAVDIDAIIQKIDQADLSILKGTYIHFRSRDYQTPNSSIYFISKLDNHCAPYVVTVNEKSKTVSKVSNDLLFDSECVKGYLSKQRIKRLMSAFLKYNLCLMKVDQYGNVFINPSRPAPPILAKKSFYAEPGDFKEFELYKGNWYLRASE